MHGSPLLGLLVSSEDTTYSFLDPRQQIVSQSSKRESARTGSICCSKPHYSDFSTLSQRSCRALRRDSIPVAATESLQIDEARALPLMAPHVPQHTAALPTRRFFDPWNSASTGHQHAENRLASSTAWRNSRNAKLQSQFAGGLANSGGKRMYDSIGAGSSEFGEDGRTATGWDKSVRGWRGRQGIGKDQGDIRGWVRSGGKAGFGKLPEKETIEEKKELFDETEQKAYKRVKLSSGRSVKSWKSTRLPSSVDSQLPPPSAQPPRDSSTSSESPPFSPLAVPTALPDASGTKIPGMDQNDQPSDPNPPPQIFDSLTIYVNGTTMPLISDYKLKHLLTTHGARTSLALGRRTVTHVILGKPNAGVGHGAGGGLAGGKIEKEVLKKRGSGNGIRYVSVEW